MTNLAAMVTVFLAGFVIMVLEIIGARYLAKDFGSSFYVWVSQIGVVLMALAGGYYLGGVVADRWRRPAGLAGPLWATAALLWGLPSLSPRLIDLIVLRHPADQPVPQLWQKLDPVLGSTVIFLLPCAVLAALSPYMIRREARNLAQVGRSSGRVIAAGTVGSIAGVFVAGFVLIDHMTVSNIFRTMGAVTAGLGVLCLTMDRGLSSPGAAPLEPGERHEG
jgi:hypothetical protein